MVEGDDTHHPTDSDSAMVERDDTHPTRPRSRPLYRQVDYWGVPMGLSRAMAGGKTGTPLQRTLKAAIDLYLATFTSVTEQCVRVETARGVGSRLLCHLSRSLARPSVACILLYM